MEFLISLKLIKWLSRDGLFITTLKKMKLLEWVVIGQKKFWVLWKILFNLKTIK